MDYPVKTGCDYESAFPRLALWCKPGKTRFVQSLHKVRQRCLFGRFLAAVRLLRRSLMHLELLLLVVMRLHLLGLLLMAQLHLLRLVLTGVRLGRLLMFRLLLLH